MQGKVFLVRWSEPEAVSATQDLRINGWTVDYEFKNGGKAYKKIKKGKPDFVVIYLDLLPAHGMELAESLVDFQKQGKLEMILVGGSNGTVKEAYEKFPHLTFSTHKRLNDVLSSKFEGEM